MVELTVTVKFTAPEKEDLAPHLDTFTLPLSAFERLWYTPLHPSLALLYLGLRVLPEKYWKTTELLGCNDFEALREALLAPQTLAAVELLLTNYLALLSGLERSLRAKPSRELAAENDLWAKVTDGLIRLGTTFSFIHKHYEARPLVLAPAARRLLNRSLVNEIARSPYLFRVSAKLAIQKLHAELAQEGKLREYLLNLQERGLILAQEGRNRSLYLTFPSTL